MTTEAMTGPAPRRPSGWIETWKPEDLVFWQATGSRIAWQTLIITTSALLLSFSTWFVMSAVVVRLPNVGFKFTTMELFWLTAMPGLAGGLLRILHTFLIPLFGTRKVITIATFLKLIPAIGIGLAVMNPATPYWIFFVLAFCAGFGGGDFSSFMPSTSLFFPKRLQGTALGIQAGIGNFGVSVVQFLTPWIIGFALIDMWGAPQTFVKGEVTKSIWLQNAAFIYAPFLVLFGIWAWISLRSLPVHASFSEQTDIFRSKHTWFCTITYVMTFGSFSGFSATFPLLIKEVYGAFPGAPDPLKYAFWGPLIGSTVRVLFGPISDKFGGGIVTHIAGLGLIVCAGTMAAGGLLTPDSLAQFDAFFWLMMATFFFSGVGNASTFRQYPIIFAGNPRQGAGVLGWTGAVAAFGPFIFSMLIGKSITLAGSAIPFFIGACVYYAFATGINWWYYTRRGAEVRC